MARKFVISEEQYNMALKEGVTLNADVTAAGGDVKRAVDTAKQETIKIHCCFYFDKQYTSLFDILKIFL